MFLFIFIVNIIFHYRFYTVSALLRARRNNYFVLKSDENTAPTKSFAVRGQQQWLPLMAARRLLPQPLNTLTFHETDLGVILA